MTNPASYKYYHLKPSRGANFSAFHITSTNDYNNAGEYFQILHSDEKITI